MGAGHIFHLGTSSASPFGSFRVSPNIVFQSLPERKSTGEKFPSQTVKKASWIAKFSTLLSYTERQGKGKLQMKYQLGLVIGQCTIFARLLLHSGISTVPAVPTLPFERAPNPKTTNVVPHQIFC